MRPSDHLLESIRPALPGTTPPKRALFIDRWGTLLEQPERGYEARFDKCEFTPAAIDLLFRASQAGWQIYLIGNEDAVARGKLADATWERFEAELLAHLGSLGVPIARNYACLDHPEHGKGTHLKDSVFLLPNTGPMYHAKQHDGIQLDESWVIGDSTIELAAGWRAGCRTAAVKTGLAGADGTLEIDPAFHGENLGEVLAEILTHARAHS
jgi:D-glycero-D-manno-heptose 1,7-bisphosphate phosphatase